MSVQPDDASEAEAVRASDVVSLRLSPDLAMAFRLEALSRRMRLNALFEEMWNLYLKDGSRT
jgi:hypothetical protein